MTQISWPSGPFAARFWHRFGLFDHLKAGLSRARRSFAPARRISAWFGRGCRCAQLSQNGRHTSAHLSGGDDLSPSFPGPKARLAKLASQHQLVHGCGYHQAPALKLLRGAHPCFGPEQVLLEEAVGVLMREAVTVGRLDLAQRQGRWSHPTKPALERIAPGSFGPFSHDTVDTHFHLSGLSNRQIVPGSDLDRLARFVAALPLLVRLSPGFGIASLKQVSIFARSASFPRKDGWSSSIELAIAFEAHQGFYREALTGRQKGAGRIPAIRQHTHPIRQERPQVFQLRNSYPNRRLRACNALLREERSPTAATIGQEHHGRELPSHAHRPLGMRQVRDVDDAAIWAGFRFGASNARTVKADPDSPF